uniref:Kunitz/Bovine pancreatic trypsin inhibitor domain protein n=1 Tax=Syphacia muris TaxID=451379 RepID=A0A158R5Y4_9BILA
MVLKLHSTLIYLVALTAIHIESTPSDVNSILSTVKNLFFGQEADQQRPRYVNLTTRQVQAEQQQQQPQQLVIYQQPRTFYTYSPSNSGSACNLPQQIGTGPYRIPRWYYNPARMRCELFYWSGCCGNGNNFQTFQNCQQVCEGKFGLTSSPVTFFATNSECCLMPFSSGYGNESIPRWYFDSKTGSCILFYFRGKGGYGNNFASASDCLLLCRGAAFAPNTRVDPCIQERDQGVGALQLPRYYFNQQSKMCEQFIYFGSAGNRNNFLTLDECQRRCPESPNPCAYGSSSNQVACSPNTVVTDPCGSQQYCHVGQNVVTTVCCNKPPTGDKCSQPLNVGVGNSNLQRWYYNPLTQQCQIYVYKGLQGNENNFLSQQECENACFANPCSLGTPYRNQGLSVQCSAQNQGVCPSGYYCHIGVDSQTSVCCQSTASTPCNEPMASGEGKSSLTRYFYDANKRQCLTFTYFGLKGNTNNFLSKEACESRCPVWVNPCITGNPLLNFDKKPQQCSQKSPCPFNYFCHIGIDASTTVCCPSTGDPCKLPLSTGQGDQSINRWFYEQNTRRCLPFIYKGLGGNENNFLQRDHCESTCPVWINPCTSGEPLLLTNGRPKQCNPLSNDSCPSTHWCHPGGDLSVTVCCPGNSDPCTQSKTEGQGQYAQQRWYFDQARKKCFQFTFKGLMGNANNFLSEHDCETRCPVYIDPCPTTFAGQTNSIQQVISCTVTDHSCPASYWCHVGATPETTACCPNAGNPCLYPPKNSGIGDQKLIRWSFDANLRKCLSFEYRGLKGNQNNFLTLESCEEQCPIFENPCKVGEVYMVDNKPLICNPHNSCPNNYYCHIGAMDNYYCCPDQGGDPCAQPMDHGQGNSQLQRWYWNMASRQCIAFIYSGTKGTQNNFLSKQDCERTCYEIDNPCALGNPQLGTDNRPVACGAGVQSCLSSFWCHIGATSETTVCCPGRVTDDSVCHQPMSMGSGDAKLQRWYYDAINHKCVLFVYNGRYGNQNNFLTEQQCQQACSVYNNVCPSGEPLLDSTNRVRPCTFGANSCGSGYWCHLGLTSDEYMCCPGEQTEIAACQGLPFETGVTGASVPPTTRWYYDRTTMSCKTFQYNGRQGNQNNFLTEADCAATCEVFVNPCSLPISMPPRTCSTPTGCGEGMYCHFGATSQSTVCCPLEGDICSLPESRGSGTAYLERWFFNAQTGSCQQFTYTGVKGNANNFLSRELCEETCGLNPCPEGRPFVGADGRTQSCSATSQVNTCPSSYWCHTGGDQSTTVCCPGASANPCNLPMSTGEGSGSYERYYFDSVTRTCRPFTYRGLKGNQNNFLTLRACQLQCQPLENPCTGQPATTAAGQVLFCSSTNKDTCPVNFWCHVGATPETTVCCPGATNPCSVPLSPGTGNAGLARWYYNPDDRTCQPFTYNGKRGNQNNFESELECSRTCPVFENPCMGEVARDSQGRPQQCNSLQPNLCRQGYFCLLGDPAIKSNSYCCPKTSEDPCNVYLNEGAGFQGLSRWYYNPTEGECFPFLYRGQKGNENNFLSQRACEETCKPVANTCFGGNEPLRVNGKIVQCALRPCPHQYYCHIGQDSRSTVCCKRNGNICDQQLMIGIGSANLLRWYYDSVTDSCVAFNYSGLGGNENNFLSKLDCQVACPGYSGYCPHGKPLVTSDKIVPCGIDSVCPKGYVCHVTRKNSKSICCPDPSDFCLLSRDFGPCDKTVIKYGYNSLTGLCQKFKYGGCLGNLNNFDSMKDCTEVCCDKGY